MHLILFLINVNIPDTVVSKDPYLILYYPDKYKTQRMFDSVVSEDPSLIVHGPDKCKNSKNVWWSC